MALSNPGLNIETYNNLASTATKVGATLGNDVVSAIIWGGSGVFLFLLPILYYLKRFYKIQQGDDDKSLFEVIAGAFMIQIALVCILSTAAYFSNQMSTSGTSYDAKSGIRFFYTGSKNATSVSTLRLWDVWKSNADLDPTNITISQEQGIKTGAAIVIFYLSILLYFTLFFLTIGLFVYPIFHYLRQNQRGTETEKSLWDKFTMTILLYLGIWGIFYFHQAIANGYISVFGSLSGFSFWGMSQEVWREIFDMTSM